MYKWYLCPCCGKKLFMIAKDAVVKGVTIKCKQCKNLILVSLEPKKQ